MSVDSPTVKYREADSPGVKYQNYLLVTVVIMLTGAAVALNQFKVPTLMTNLSDIFSMPMSKTAWTMSIFTVAGIFLALPTGGLAQKFDPKKLLIAAALFVGVGALLGSFATSGNMLIFSRGVEGVGQVFFAIAGPLAVARYVEPAKIGSAMGIWATWLPIGQIVAFNLSPVLFGSIGWSGVWLVFGVVAFIMALAVGFLVKGPEDSSSSIGAGESPAIREANAKTSEAFTNKNLWYLYFSWVLFNVVLFAVLTYTPTFLKESGMDVSKAAFVTSLPMILGIFASMILGNISDRINSKKKLYVFTSVVIGLGAALMFTSTGTLLYLGVFLCGLSMGAPGLAMAAVPEIAKKPELFSVSMALMILWQNVGIVVGSSSLILMMGSWTVVGMVLIPAALIGAGLAAAAKFK